MQMRSTSVWAGQRSDVRAAGTQYSGGFYTSASAVTGGITTYDSYNPEEGSRAGGPNRAPGVPGMPTPVDGDGLGILFLALLAAGYACVVWRRGVKSENAK